ncbi:MAG: hypothetical protein NZ914_01280 [Gemmatales bacterium]|nr:hypothetical protein [Gemmatales bacterium]
MGKAPKGVRYVELVARQLFHSARQGLASVSLGGEVVRQQDDGDHPMKRQISWVIAAALGVLGWLSTGVVSQEIREEPDSDPTAFIAPEGWEGTGEAVPEGAKPVLRGPVHEAFAQPARVRPQPGPIVPREPPRPIEEIPPDQKPAGENVQWIPGYWYWDDEKEEFLWVSGIWRAIPPGMEWVPGTWVRVEGGWQWVPGYWKPVAQKEVEVVPEPPEPPPLADPPPAPGPDYFYVPGNWVYVDFRWYWRPGVWVLFRPGWVWTPACYYWTPYGYVFVDGFWDFPFRWRGWLFCPIWVDFAICYRPGWFWRPCFWVPEPCLTSFLFVHTRRFSFFFGDFYDPFYARSGFVSIFYYRVHPGCFDPLVNYYALAYRGQDPQWLARQRWLTQARMQGTAPRPPRTLEEQRKLLAAAAGDPERQRKLRELAVAGSVSRINPKTVPTQKLDNKQLEVVRKAAEETRRVQQQRSELERKLAQAKPEPGKAPLRVQPVAVKNLAQVPAAKTPPPPVLPKSELKPPPTTGKPTDDKTKPLAGKPGEDKTKPTPGKPGDDKSKPTPVQPREDKTKPPLSKPIEDKTKPRPSKPIEDQAKPGPGKPIEDQTKPLPGKPIEDKTKPAPSKPMEDKVRPGPAKPIEDKAKPIAPRPAEEPIRPPVSRPGAEKPQPPAGRPAEEKPRPGPSRPPGEGRPTPGPGKPSEGNVRPTPVRPSEEPVRPPARPSERPVVPARAPEERTAPSGVPSAPPGRVVPSAPPPRVVPQERPVSPTRPNERPAPERPRGAIPWDDLDRAHSGIVPARGTISRGAAGADLVLPARRASAAEVLPPSVARTNSPASRAVVTPPRAPAMPHRATSPLPSVRPGERGFVPRGTNVERPWAAPAPRISSPPRMSASPFPRGVGAVPMRGPTPGAPARPVRGR